MKEVYEKKIVSVIMPAYNCAAYIGQAVQSVQKQQVDWELIIIDDASTDATAETMQQYLEDERIQYYRNERNMGVSYSRNLGVSKAAGKYVAFLDADDWWEEDKLEKQIALMEEKDAVLCYTGRELCAENGNSIGKKIRVPLKVDYKKLLYTNCIPCSSVIMKTEVSRVFPMEHDELHEDYLTWLRIIQKYGYAYGIDESLLKSRLTVKGKSRNKIKTIKMTYGVYRNLGIKKWQAIVYMMSHLVLSIIRYW